MGRGRPRDGAIGYALAVLAACGTLEPAAGTTMGDATSDAGPGSDAVADASGDAGLDLVLSEIDLRVAVELAKAGIR